MKVEGCWRGGLRIKVHSGDPKSPKTQIQRVYICGLFGWSKIDEIDSLCLDLQIYKRQRQMICLCLQMIYNVLQTFIVFFGVMGAGA